MATNDVTSKIPKSQILQLEYCDENHIPKYIVTSDSQTTKYTLYKVLFEKVKTSKEPTFKEVGY